MQFIDEIKEQIQTVLNFDESTMTAIKVWLIVILPFVFLWFRRGKSGEDMTASILERYLDKKAYSVINDLILPSKNGTSQLDHIVVSNYGVFIVETKTLTGWIFGSEDQKIWTQTIYGNKYKFQNPLRQTYRQKKVLSEFLNVKESHINPVVFFNGKSDFRTEMPSNVIDYRVSTYIKNFDEKVMSDEQVKSITDKLIHHKETSDLILSDHLHSLHERHNSSTCPKCGGGLVIRTSSKEPNSGNQFIGCENFPKCRFTRSV